MAIGADGPSTALFLADVTLTCTWPDGRVERYVVTGDQVRGRVEVDPTVHQYGPPVVRFTFEGAEKVAHTLALRQEWKRPALRTDLGWMLHNLVAHPLSEACYWLSLRRATRLGDWLHDVTVPEHEEGQGRG